ncbi:hypothetical protein CF327_g5139 [Tilletia walkeri]|nr:hypothetical protein CF327_g5139 [Tilletia walkeri]
MSTHADPVQLDDDRAETIVNSSSASAAKRSQEFEKSSVTSPDVEKKGADPAPAFDESVPLPRRNMTTTQFWIVLAGLNLGMFLAALDFNIVATAVPEISSQFNRYSSSSWIGSGFLFTFAMCLPIYGKLSDVFGRRLVFIIATLIFILGSGLCAGSSSMDMLIWSRVVQGIGASGIYGLVNVIIAADLVPLRDVGKYLSSVAAIWAIADLLGPLLGGVFTQKVSWNWCFWINLIISPISLIVTVVWLKMPMPEGKISKKIATFDYIGTLLLLGGTACLTLAIEWGGKTFPWEDARIIGMFVAGPIMWILFGIWEFKFAKDPLILPELFRNTTLIPMYVAEFCYGANLLGMMYWLPSFFQIVYGDSAILSGVGLLPMMLGLGFGNPLAGWITSRYGISHMNAVVGGALILLFSGLLIRWTSHTSRVEAVFELIFLGLGQGAMMSGMLLTAQVAVPPMLIGLATSTVIFAQLVGTIFGIASFSSIFLNAIGPKFNEIGLPAETQEILLRDVSQVRKVLQGEQLDRVIEAYAASMQGGWILMTGFAAGALIFICFSRQHKFADKA